MLVRLSPGEMPPLSHTADLELYVHRPRDPEAWLHGLAGQLINRCATEPPGPCRWVGGIGHELGHALGLPHPPECEDGDPATACPHTIMWNGFR